MGAMTNTLRRFHTGEKRKEDKLITVDYIQTIIDESNYDTIKELVDWLKNNQY